MHIPSLQGGDLQLQKGSNHVTPLTVVDLSRTSARDIQFLSTEKSWRRHFECLRVDGLR
ncbi:hypothetical protein Bca101_039076 [Brassica carinata]